MGNLRGLIVRCGLTALPLGAVVLLCCLMMGWPGRAQSQARLFSAPPSAAAQAATLPAQTEPSNKASFWLPGAQSPQQHQPAPQRVQAAFERLHITHARINVPN